MTKEDDSKHNKAQHTVQMNTKGQENTKPNQNQE